MGKAKVKEMDKAPTALREALAGDEERKVKMFDRKVERHLKRMGLSL